MICTIQDCGQECHARGWCRKHYLRWRKHGDPLGGGTPKGETVRWLLAHVTHDDTANCLSWPYAKTAGYGETFWNGKPALAHRVMCTLAHGQPPTPKHDAAHNCGRGADGCVNPHHLRWATRKDNNADKLMHDTHNRGERNWHARLTENDVRKIRILGMTLEHKVIAEIFGVSRPHISDIIDRTRWGWLE